MKYAERPVLFDLAGETLLGILAAPETPGARGVLVVVGGPQYRAGSHRQFLLLSRRLAGEGIPVFRFDYRGMGDSGGAMRGFEDVSEDIGAAIDVFFRQVPGLRRCVLWGLCDAASAILLHCRATGDSRVDGVALVNPWVRSESGLAQTRIRHHYGQRLLQREFWRKLLAGRLNVAASLRGFFGDALAARQGTACRDRPPSFRERMAEGLGRFRGEALLILSGRDYTAREFIGHAAADPAWTGLLDAAKLRRADLPEADHTFSSAAWRAGVEDETLRWLQGIASSNLDAAPGSMRER
jgi:exosortase A-associated hydrolase 1